MPTNKENLARANALAALPWVQHTPHHWSIKVGFKRADYWPSTQRFRWSASRGRRATLYADIKKAEELVVAQMPSTEVYRVPYFTCSASYCPNGGPTCNKHNCPQERL